MRAIQYFGLNQWGEMREFVAKLIDEKSNLNLAIYVDIATNSSVVKWDEELIDLENK